MMVNMRRFQGKKMVVTSFLPDVTEKNHKKLYLKYSESSSYLKIFPLR